MAYEEYFPECCYGANEVPQISMMRIKDGTQKCICYPNRIESPGFFFIQKILP